MSGREFWATIYADDPQPNRWPLLHDSERAAKLGETWARRAGRKPVVRIHVRMKARAG